MRTKACMAACAATLLVVSGCTGGLRHQSERGLRDPVRLPSAPNLDGTPKTAYPGSPAGGAMPGYPGAAAGAGMTGIPETMNSGRPLPAPLSPTEPTRGGASLPGMPQ
jgi:hypothetical protein